MGVQAYIRLWFLSRISGTLSSKAGRRRPERSNLGRMPPETDSAAPPAPLVVNDYDSFAAAYTAETEANLVNGYYMRPAMVDLAGDVAGRRILDAGCGSGPISAKLRDKGAI